MTLKELQGMIKEELESYMGENEVDVDVDTDGGDIDADGAEEGNTDEDVLRQIYDMLKDKFEMDYKIIEKLFVYLRIVKLLKLHKGFLPYHDKSSPDDIYAFFAMSKKAFKMNVGILYKSKLITIEEGGIRLAEVDPNASSNENVTNVDHA